MIPNGEAEVELAMRRFAKMPSATCLLKEDTDGPMNVWIGGTFTVVEIVKTFFAKIERIDAI